LYFRVSVDHFGFVFSVGLSFFAVPRQQIGWEEHLRNDLFCVKWDSTNQSSSVEFGHILLKLEWDFAYFSGWGLSAGYQPRPQVVDRGTTARYGGQLRYI